MFENTRDSWIVAAAMDIHATRSISELTGVSSIVAPKDPYFTICTRVNVKGFGCRLVGYLSVYNRTSTRPFPLARR
ncbi:hypothetical protein TNCV_84111 [Trichonephila clavipes]|nr:hypothetical protein TNCV_84111 [Trichonephila clavipes]